MGVCVTGMWVMINQVRQDTRDKRNTDMEEEASALVQTDMNHLEALMSPIGLVNTDQF